MKREWTITEISTTRKLEATDGQENEWYKKEGGKIQNLNYARTHAHTHSSRISVMIAIETSRMKNKERRLSLKNQKQRYINKDNDDTNSTCGRNGKKVEKWRKSNRRELCC